MYIALRRMYPTFGICTRTYVLATPDSPPRLYVESGQLDRLRIDESFQRKASFDSKELFEKDVVYEACATYTVQPFSTKHLI